ncbi:hypothetical protein [Leisingera aquaemixtae]|uniref:Uncharacterized protein n=2 Tax=Leisingera aquaemixtae TaxID=1396826 RepID=A0ABY5WEU4_9RHOB|nr:hypothetical protein [Leisingera aquaemixtae]UWQ23375.1 hypothetical protein K3553_10195 [Leisingera aquaemixtae]UWQ35897.1 hypothetical protein K3552_10140 [Leisingera aquaemixtae]UWQ39990.1 hypothetical protein K3718_10385 [Leisingera aquaemixtae]
MNINWIINMVLRRLVSRAVGAGVNAGINAVARRSKPQDRGQGQSAPPVQQAGRSRIPSVKQGRRQR